MTDNPYQRKADTLAVLVYALSLLALIPAMALVWSDFPNIHPVQRIGLAIGVVASIVFSVMFVRSVWKLIR